MNKRFTLIALTLLFLAVVLLSIGNTGKVSAAPVAVPTPVSVSRAVAKWFPVTYWDTAPLTADARAECFETAANDLIDIQYVIDQGAGVPNTTTIKLQHSVDNSTFIDGVSLVTSNSADASDLEQFQVFGRYTCLYADVSNTNAVTLTIKAVVK